MKHKTYDTFSGIMDPRLRAFNRLAIFYNITRDCGQADGKQYLDQFDDISKAHIRSLTEEMREKGYSTVRRSLSVTTTIH